MQLSSKAKENGDHSAQVTAGNAMAAYESTTIPVSRLAPSSR